LLKGAQARVLGRDKEEIVKSSAVDFLISSQNSDGGWGYAPQQGSAVEPTSAVLLALREDPSCIGLYRRASDWLRSAQHEDGGWGFNSKDKESGWQTAWAVLTLTQIGEGKAALKRGIKWILNVPVLKASEDSIQAGKKIIAIDLSLRGWPWLPGESTWVEPTALTILSLSSASNNEFYEPIRGALRYIQDRRCQGGGWNMGNPFMFSKSLPARAHTTALVLLALGKLAPESIIPEDIKALRSDMQQDPGIQGLAWGLLALKTLKINDTDTLAESRLAALQDKDGGWGNNPYKTAIATMAFKGYF
jgi:hypothetical protein